MQLLEQRDISTHSLSLCLFVSLSLYQACSFSCFPPAPIQVSYYSLHLIPCCSSAHSCPPTHPSYARSHPPTVVDSHCLSCCMLITIRALCIVTTMINAVFLKKKGMRSSPRSATCPHPETEPHETGLQEGHRNKLPPRYK